MKNRIDTNSRRWQVSLVLLGLIFFATEGIAASLDSLDTLGEQKSLAVGLNLRSPYASAEQLFDRNFSYGVMSTLLYYSTPSGSILGFGALGSVNYYSGVLSGLWGRLAVGIGVVDLKEGEESSRRGRVTACGVGTLGWQWRTESGYRFSAFGGVSALSDVEVREALRISGLLPSVGIELGWVY